MKILVAGGAGYVGSMLVPKLKEIGHNVDVVDLLWFGNNLPSDINVIKKDIFNLNPDDMKDYDQVVFLAGVSNDPMAEFSPKYNFIQNSSCPTYLAFICKEAGVKRFVFASSCSIYGFAPDKFYTEEDIPKSKYPYGLAKAQAEFGIHRMADENFSVISLRKGTVNGFSTRMRFDLVANTMFKFAMTTGQVTVNSPDLWRPLISINDAVQGYVDAIQSEYTISGIFNIFSENYTILDIGKKVKKILEEKLGMKIELIIKNIPDFRNYRASKEKAEKILNFKSKDNLESMVENLIEHTEVFGDYNNPKFYNIEIFKNLELIISSK